MLDMRLGAMAGMPVVLRHLEAKRETQVDVFGLEVHNANVKHEEEETDTAWIQEQETEDDRTIGEPCSVVLADSPSTLDLSALMC